ncbi:MAG: 4-coumarate--CoA ligase family protein, partial [Corynebacterium sp.]|uniref:AMP-binding protein n=1 Tax=Corynebacterium sp. TaxID=1720 RepID=UPI002653BC96|nr:4-coumarate--CoA ligase family protein [Corynebacterium sp.]
MPVASPRPTIEIPEVSIYDLLFGSLTAEENQRTAITDSATGAVVSYGELRQQVDLFAGALASRGVGVGDVVARHCPDTPRVPRALHRLRRARA